MGLWNTEWAKAASFRGRRLRDGLRRMEADVLCVAEGEVPLLPDPARTITSGPDYGYPAVDGRRKVLLWSATGWSDVDAVGDPALPPGRYVAGTTDTPLGPVRVVGACVPWRDAHVRTGRRDRGLWQDHLAYLAALGPLLARERVRHGRLLLVGDLNQRIPRAGQPARVADALEAALAGLTVVTAGASCEGRRLIDHVAVAGDLAGRSVRTIPRADGAGRLSDHDGVVAELGPEGAVSAPNPGRAMGAG